MNILITGIHGFVGSNLIKTLSSQHTIWGIDIVTPQKEGVEKTYLWTELDQINDIDVIIHLAGKAHDTKNKSAAQVYFDVNTGLTQKIYDWFNQSTASKFIFFSSVKAAADQVDGDILTEEVVPSPRGPYGESKIKSEDYILKSVESLSRLSVESAVSAVESSDVKQASETSVTQTCKGCNQEPVARNPLKKFYILRPCMIHGPGNKGNLNLLYQVVSKGIPWPLGAFENRRSFTSIDNLCFAINGFISKDIESGIYHIGDDEPVSTNELIQLIAQSVDKNPQILNIPVGFMKGIAKVGDTLRLPLDSQRLQKLTENYVVSNDKLKKALGVERMPVTAREGLLKTLRSFR